MMNVKAVLFEATGLCFTLFSSSFLPSSPADLTAYAAQQLLDVGML